MIDVFFCSCAKPDDKIRMGMRTACWARWELEPDIRLILVTPELIGASGKEFQSEHRRYAAENAQSDAYVVAEDDVMPLGKDFVSRGLYVMTQYPDYGVLVARTIWEQPTQGVLDVNGDGIDFVRAGVIQRILGPRGEWFDGNVQAARLREIGIKTGRMGAVAANHLGFRLGTCWPDDYQSGMTQIAAYP